MKRIGLFFGSFAPFHCGHLLLVQEFYRQFSLDEVRLIFTPQSPFKKKKNLQQQKFYISLLQKICCRIPFLKLDLIETKMKAPHYSFLSLQKIQQKINSPSNFFFLIGSDNFEKFHYWKKFQFILENTSLVCYPRNFFNQKKFHLQKKKLLQQLKSYLPIYFLPAKKKNISSTEIRKKIAQKKSIQKDVPSSIYYLIKNNVSH